MTTNRVTSLWYRFNFWLRGQYFAFTTFTLIILLIALFLWPRVFITVHAGEAGVLYRRFAGGTIFDRVYEEGFWIIWPWNIMTIYNTRVQAIKHDFTVLSADGLPIHLMLLIRFKPEYATLGVLHQSVGPDYVDKIVVPTVESVIRKSIGNFRQEEIYQTKKGILASIVHMAIQEAGRKFVQMDDVIIRTIELPPPIQKAIENKLVYEQELESYQFRLTRETREAQRREIEAEGIRKYHHIISQSLDEKALMWRGIEATQSLANSANAKVVVFGSGKNGLPLIGTLSFEGSESSPSSVKAPVDLGKTEKSKDFAAKPVAEIEKSLQETPVEKAPDQQGTDQQPESSTPLSNARLDNAAEEKDSLVSSEGKTSSESSPPSPPDVKPLPVHRQ
ncbi:MAG: hypothetical protein HW380_2764 [Magnetococcales bacterium]|nr:hypothetical protein [Magnetococcales bacterium]